VNVDQVLQGVIEQFSHRVTCLRELVQNALDADTNRIDVWFDERDGYKRIAVEDYGCGMTLEDVDEYLLNVFKSSKEDDLESIGRFGIGFVSVFALKPAYVAVETSKNGEHTRIVIDSAMGIQYFEGDPRAGTCVSLYLKMSDSEFSEVTREGIGFLDQSCRYVEAELAVNVEGEERILSRPLEINAPMSVRHDEAGTEIRVGYGTGEPTFRLMNRRLVLEHADRALLPGVTVLASSRDIEHNLARNAIIQDGNFQRFMATLTRLVEKELFPQLLERVTRRKAGVSTLRILGEVLSFFDDPDEAPAPYNALLKLDCIPILDEGVRRDMDLRRVLEWAWDGELALCREETPLIELISHTMPVALSTAKWPIADTLELIGPPTLPDIASSFASCQAVSASVAAQFSALCEAATRMLGRRVEAADIDMPESGVALAVDVPALDTVWFVNEAPDGDDILALNVAHPLAKKLAAQAKHTPDIAAQLLLRALETTETLEGGTADVAFDGLLAVGG